MESLLLIKEAAAQAQRSEESVRAIIKRAKLLTGELFGKMAVYSNDMPFIKAYPRSNRRTKAEIERMKNAQADVEFAENFGAEPMQLNEAKVPANVKQPFAAPTAQAPAETLQLQDLGGGKYALPAGWKIENGTLVKAKGLPKSMQDVVANYDADIYLSDRYNEIQTAAFTLLDLLVLRDIYNNGWEAKWTGKEAEKQPKPNIFFDKYHKPTRGTQVDYPTHFVFKDTDTRDAFYNNFQTKLQTIAKLLM